MEHQIFKHVDFILSVDKNSLFFRDEVYGVLRCMSMENLALE